MDDYGLDRPELTTSLMSLEFGPGGRIHQLWVGDPNAPDESEEFQFIAPPVTMGEEVASDYYPGTILLGARTHPEEPWIVSRNTSAEQIGDEDDFSTVAFRYEFSFLDELEATGRFYEMAGRLPQIVWELTIKNRSRRSVEIGELGFPLALNNVLEGFPRTDHGTRELFHDRVHVHPFIGGSASYVHAQRMSGVSPGLLIYPGGETKWEFFDHVPASLNTNYQWPGVPVVYIHSQAAIEREEWPEWFFGHSATVLEPGEERRYEMRFAPTDRHYTEGISASLASFGKPSIELLPGAVAPVDVGISMQVSGATPTRFWSEQQLDLETDSDEEGGFCFIKPQSAGTMRVGFDDTAGRESQTQVLFTKPIRELILARANWIVNEQVVGKGPLKRAIVAGDNHSDGQLADIRHFANPFALKSGLADALFLAEKNTIYPDPAQIAVLDAYISDFLEARVRNPGDGGVGCVLPTAHGAAACFGYPEMYPLVTLLYGSMARIGEGFATRRPAAEYLRLGAETAMAMWPQALSDQLLEAPLPLMSYMPGFLSQLERSTLGVQANELRSLLEERWRRLSSRKYPFATGAFWDPSAFEEVIAAARFSGNTNLKERVLRCLLSGRSSAPAWWWYGSDRRWGSTTDGNDAALDNGELCLGAPTAANSAVLFSLFQRDYAHLPEELARLAFGGMLSIWALVREDGAAAMAYCPDQASSHFGIAATTGDVGIGLYHYLRSTGAFVLPTLGNTLAVFGCKIEVEQDRDVDVYTVTPWDGVGRRVIVRQISLEVETTVGVIEELRFDARKRKARIALQNPSGKDLSAEVFVRGLWGKACRAAGTRYLAEAGMFRLPVLLKAHETKFLEIEVCE
jgi:hypothetical protein